MKKELSEMTELQKIALEIAIKKNAFNKKTEDEKNEAILSAYEDAKLFMFLTGKEVQKFNFEINEKRNGIK